MMTNLERLQKIQQDRKKKNRRCLFSRLTGRGKSIHNFLTSEMWRMHDSELKGLSGSFVRILQVLYISIVEFVRGSVSQKANSLTYSTILSMVPLLVVVLSVAAGFGLQTSVQRQLYEYFPAQQHELTQAFKFAESYLEQIQSSLFIGVSVLLLLYAVMILLMNVENVLNEVWQIRTPRPLSRRILGYLAAFLVLPLMVALSAGSNIFMSIISDIHFLGHFSTTPFLEGLAQFIPYAVWIFLFTSLYIVLPNTRVRFLPAFISGVISGITFQLFQLLYISGQIWVSKYNSIYGSFAAIPLLMLFTNWSWVICLFGAQLAYSIQNVKHYTFKHESERVSRRFRDFVAVVLMKKICTAFVSDNQVYTATQLAKECRLPLVVVNDTLDKLCLCNLLQHRPNKKRSTTPFFSPGLAVTTISIRRIVTALDRLGEENFRIDIYEQYAKEWALVRAARPGSKQELDAPLTEL